MGRRRKVDDSQRGRMGARSTGCTLTKPNKIKGLETCHTRPKKIFSWAGSVINSEIARMWSFLYPLMSY